MIHLYRRLLNSGIPLFSKRVIEKIGKKLYTNIFNDRCLPGELYPIKIREHTIHLWLDWRDATDSLFIVHRLWEESNTNFILKNLAGGVFVDLGANVGYFSHLASKLSKHVYAVEPMKRNIFALKKGSGYTILPYAISDRDGHTNLVSRTCSSGSPSIVGYFGVGKPVEDAYMENERVETRSLESLFREIGHERVRIMKMDIQGAEYLVLKAAEHLIQNIDYFIIEYSPTSYGDEVISLMLRHGYTPYGVSEDGELVRSPRFENKRDYVFTKIVH